MKKELEFYAEVVVTDSSMIDRDLVNSRGVVIGKSRDVKGNELFYTVMVFDLGEAIVIPGSGLKSTGRMIPRAEMFCDESLRVIVDPKSGEGHVGYRTADNRTNNHERHENHEQ